MGSVVVLECLDEPADVEVPAWMFDILVLFHDDFTLAHGCGHSGDDMRDWCPECQAWKVGQERQWSRYFTRGMVAAHVAEYDPARYAAEMRDAGRGHLLAG